VLVARGIEERAGGVKRRMIVGFEGCAAPENLTGEIVRFKPTHLVLVDAADLGREPGAVAIIAPERITGTSFSTHTLPLRIIIDYITQATGARAVVVGIQPEHTAFCAEPSARVLAAVDQLVDALLGAVES
jgi:hydrogenase 3 maturation protease